MTHYKFTTCQVVFRLATVLQTQAIQLWLGQLHWASRWSMCQWTIDSMVRQIHSWEQYSMVHLWPTKLSGFCRVRKPRLRVLEILASETVSGLKLRENKQDLFTLPWSSRAIRSWLGSKEHCCIWRRSKKSDNVNRWSSHELQYLADFWYSWGESAGAISASFQFLANDGNANGLFRGAFMVWDFTTTQVIH